jgi:hypothetical protein
MATATIPSGKRLALPPVRSVVAVRAPKIGRKRRPVSRTGLLSLVTPNAAAARVAVSQTGWKVETSQSSRGWADQPA